MNYLSKRDNNWGSLMDFRREMDSLFEDFFSPTLGSGAARDNIRLPAYQLQEEDNHYLVSLEMPGIPKENIKIEVLNDTVNISGEHHFENKKKGFSESRSSRFQRSFALPPGTDTEKLEADYRDGILHMTIPKSESQKPRQIKIGGGSGFLGKFLGEGKKKEEDSSKKEQTNVA